MARLLTCAHDLQVPLPDSYQLLGACHIVWKLGHFEAVATDTN
jgi:hypothetical protein